MKKLAFHRCLRLVPTMTSAQRNDLKIALEQRDKKDLVAEVASLMGIPTCCPRCHHPGIRSWKHVSSLPRYRCKGVSSQGPVTFLPGEILRGRNRSERPPGAVPSTRKPPSSGGIVFWPCPRTSGPARRAESSRRTRATFCVRSRDNGIFRDLCEKGKVGRRSAGSPSSRFQS